MQESQKYQQKKFEVNIFYKPKTFFSCKIILSKKERSCRKIHLYAGFATEFKFEPKKGLTPVHFFIFNV